jgi:hypothetical protein
MKRPHLSLLGAVTLTSFVLNQPAQCVIVAGASGGGNTSNNTNRSQLESELATQFPAYENVVSYSDASGVYIGYDPATKDVWVLTARHVTPGGSTIVIDGLTYDRQADGDGFGFLVGGDLRLVRYTRPDQAVPSLPAVKINTTVPVAETSLVMIGSGQNRVENAAPNAGTSDAASVTVGLGYHWSGTNIERWGTNNIEAEFPNSLESTGPVLGTTGTFSMGGYDTVGFNTDFDQPASGQWLSSNEAQGSLGDSGGGAFYYDGTQWVLAGIFSSVTSFAGQDPSSAGFGNRTLITDVATYNSGINAALGGVTLVPEPASAALVGLAFLAFAGRRRR